ncbi:hypothetical protein DVH05_004776 [Phytophthora capsici]|nr:hypothetical protein DVH05_004776 [Phytophthora capsici]
MQLTSNIAAVKEEVLNVVEKMLGMTDQLHYQVVTGCIQKDNHSCGVWCLVVLELLLFGARPSTWDDYWSDTLYGALDYLRLRYLRMVIDLHTRFSVVEDEDEQ